MSSDFRRTLKDYQATMPETPRGYLFTPAEGLGSPRFSMGNTNEPIQDSGFSSMGPEGTGGGGVSAHMWQVESAGMTEAAPEAEPPVVAEPRYTVRGGIVVVQGTRVDVAAVPAVTFAGNGFVVLKVVRNTASRAYDAGIPALIQFMTTEPMSSDYEEFTVLAEITDGIITQCRNDEICSEELMIVANGEFALLPMQANSRNTYAPPL